MKTEKEGIKIREQKKNQIKFSVDRIKNKKGKSDVKKGNKIIGRKNMKNLMKKTINEERLGKNEKCSEIRMKRKQEETKNVSQKELRLSRRE